MKKGNECLRYNPVGRCIYCGNTDGPLSDEHIVPYSLDGNLVLPKASCRDCAKVTAQLEQFCTRTMFGPFRIKNNFPTRRPQERPKALPIDFKMEDGTHKTCEVPVADIPHAIGLIVPPVAKVLRGLPVDKHGRMDVGLWYYPEKPDLSQLLKKYGAVDCSLTYLKFETLQFSRFLAKIAHGYAVATIVQDYVPLAPAFVLGNGNDPNYIVGAGIDMPVPLPKENNFWQLSPMHHPSGLAGVMIRLFPKMNGPSYHVVVGMKGQRVLAAKWPARKN